MTLQWGRPAPEDREPSLAEQIAAAKQARLAREAAHAEALRAVTAKSMEKREAEQARFREEAAKAIRAEAHKKAEAAALAEVEMIRTRLAAWASDRGLAPTDQNAQAVIAYIEKRHVFTEAAVDQAILALAQQLEWLNPLLRR